MKKQQSVTFKEMIELLEFFERAAKASDYVMFLPPSMPTIAAIKAAVKNYQELVERPYVLSGRTQGHTKAIIDLICKNYKEVKIINLEDEKKLKALKIIKDEFEIRFNDEKQTMVIQYGEEPYTHIKHSLTKIIKDKEQYDLLKEVLCSSSGS